MPNGVAPHHATGPGSKASASLYSVRRITSASPVITTSSPLTSRIGKRSIGRCAGPRNSSPVRPKSRQVALALKDAVNGRRNGAAQVRALPVQRNESTRAPHQIEAADGPRPDVAHRIVLGPTGAHESAERSRRRWADEPPSHGRRAADQHERSRDDQAAARPARAGGVHTPGVWIVAGTRRQRRPAARRAAR